MTKTTIQNEVCKSFDENTTKSSCTKYSAEQDGGDVLSLLSKLLEQNVKFVFNFTGEDLDAKNMAVKLNISYHTPERRFNDCLTVRERECASLLTKGVRTKGIAKILGISPRTVETHIENMKVKLDCYSQSQLIEKLLVDGEVNLNGKTYYPVPFVQKYEAACR